MRSNTKLYIPKYSLDNNQFIHTYDCLNTPLNKVLIENKRQIWEYEYDFAKNANGYYLLLFDYNVIKQHIELICPISDHDDIKIIDSNEDICIIQSRTNLWKIEKNKFMIKDSFFTVNRFK